MTEELKFLIDLVKESSKLIDNNLDIQAKGEFGDIVTNFDLEIEKFMLKKIKEKYPNFIVISEEYNPTVELSDNCFTIDPIDGTINFANGIPLWGIQVSCIKNGKTCAAVIYMPKLDELYYADENGAFLNGEPIKVNDKNINDGLYSIEGIKGARQPKCIIGHYKMNKINRKYRELHCAAADFAWVACGRLIATNFMGNNYWDYIPGEYIVEKAGGSIHNEENAHIAANSKEVLEEFLAKTKINSNEEIVIKNN